MSSFSAGFKSFAALYGVAFLVLAVLDGLWLGFVAREFYRREMGALMNDSIRVAPAVLFYVFYPAGLVFLALQPSPVSLGQAALRCAVLGLVVYGTYDLTNLATLRGWSIQLAVADALWGTFVSAAAGTVAWWWLVGRTAAPA